MQLLPLGCALGFLFDVILSVPRIGALVGLNHVIVHQWHTLLFLMLRIKIGVIHIIPFVGSLSTLPRCHQYFLLC